MKQTKIICTIGPASESEEIIEKLALEGMDVCRINFSHGGIEEQKTKIQRIVSVREKLNKHISIAMDTRGPEIRIKDFLNGKVYLKKNQKFTFTTRDIEGNNEIVSITYLNLPEYVKRGTRILIDDGLVEFVVDSVENGTDIKCKVQNSGEILNKKGLNIPGIDFDLPALTEKDISDIRFGVEYGLDLILTSFIRTAKDVKYIKNILKECGGEHIQLYAKIETRCSTENLDEIIEAADGVCVARGDLGVETSIETVPLMQKKVIRHANKMGKPVMIATQMMDSMQRNPRPTRAEASDVANAVFDGADAIMLSGETAFGKYPVESLRLMSGISEMIEKSEEFKYVMKNRSLWQMSEENFMGKSVCLIAEKSNATAIVVYSNTEELSMEISKLRPTLPIIAVVPKNEMAKKLSAVWGIVPVVDYKKSEKETKKNTIFGFKSISYEDDLKGDEKETVEEIIDKVIKFSEKAGVVKKHGKIVIVSDNKGFIKIADI